METQISTPLGGSRQAKKVENLDNMFNTAVNFVRDQVIARIPQASNEHAETISAIHPYNDWRQVYNHVLTIH